MISTLQFAVGVIGNIISMCLFLSPLPTFWKIHQLRSTEDYSAVPYITTILNCLLWLFYGSPYVHEGILVVTINAAGLLIESLYTSIYLFYSKDKETKKRAIWMSSGVTIFFGVVVLVNMLAVSKHNREFVVGVLCVIIGTMMYISPLTIMRTVITTKSTIFMPLPLSVFNLLNGLVWTTYALISHDIFITIPNVLGVFFAVCQLGLYLCYCSPKENIEETGLENETAESTTEEKSVTELHTIQVTLDTNLSQNSTQ